MHNKRSWCLDKSTCGIGGSFVCVCHDCSVIGLARGGLHQALSVDTCCFLSLLMLPRVCSSCLDSGVHYCQPPRAASTAKCPIAAMAAQVSNHAHSVAAVSHGCLSFSYKCNVLPTCLLQRQCIPYCGIHLAVQACTSAKCKATGASLAS